mgnify:FL=1
MSNLQAHEIELKLSLEMMEARFKTIEARLWRLEAMIMGSTLIILTLATSLFIKM